LGDKLQKRRERKDKVTKEEAERRIEKTHGDSIILLEYVNVHSKAKFKCKKFGHIWEAEACSVWCGNGCPECAKIESSKRQAHPISYVKDFIKIRNCELMSDNYVNVGTKLLIKFECGHVGEISFDCFQRGTRCNICSHKIAHLKCRLSEDELKERLSLKGLNIIEFPNGYANRNSEITCRCKFGHMETRKLATVLKGNGCVTCAWIKASINQSGSKGSNWQGGKTELSLFLKKQIKQWKKESIKNCNYCCVICGVGNRFEHVHHLQSFSSIVKETMSELNLDIKPNVSDYTEEELIIMTNKILEVHYRYPLGVCLCWKHHKAFHRLYGLETGTPSDFEEFQQRIASGELILPD
jgi:hypothetical protein